MPIINSSSIAETKNITENGVYDVTRYTSADVNVEGTQPVYTKLTLSPSRNSGSFYPVDFGADGFSEVSLNAVTSDIDSNIQSQNIKDGVTILGVTGDYSGETPTLITKNITQNGTYNASSDSADGYSQVTVNVSGGGGGGLTRSYTVVTGQLIADTEQPFMGLSGANDVGDFVFANAYRNNTLITGTLDLSSLEMVNGEKAFYQAFVSCPNITSVDLSSLKSINGRDSFYLAFHDCVNISGVVDLSSLKVVNTNSNDACYGMFHSCTKITGVDLSSLSVICSTFHEAFFGCSSLVSVDLSSLYLVNTDSMNTCFANNYKLSNVNFNSLSIAHNNAFSGCFASCTELQSISFPKLSILYDYAMSYAFQDCTNLKHIYFPALADYSIIYNNTFVDMLSNVVGCTIHFPSNFNPELPNPSFDVTTLNGYPNFGGTNTILVYDQQATTNGVFYLEGLKKFESNNNELSWAFSNNNKLVDVHFSGLSALSTVCTYPFDCAFHNCSNLNSVSFDVLTEENLQYCSNAFYGLLDGCTDVTVHFPSNLQSIMGNWSDVLNGFGGTNTTVLFDLPSTAE